MSLPRTITLSLLVLILLPQVGKAQKPQSDSEIAGRFAPVFYQALGDKPRSDYITNFDFDGDWRGDNNWDHAADTSFQLKAYIYYSLVETSSHYFIHYAVFHPRDYKGGEVHGPVLTEIIRQGAKVGGQFDPTGLADEAALAHENDMEGCLVVVEKNGTKPSNARVAFVETLHHNNFSRYVAGEGGNGFAPVKVDGQRVLLYIEPKGHGIEAFTGDPQQVSKKTFVKYVYKDFAGESDHIPTCTNLETQPCNSEVTYALLSLETLWEKAKGGLNDTYGETYDYGALSVSLRTNAAARDAEQKYNIGKVGCAFVGFVGGPNMARPPWAWFDRNERDRPLGTWFFDPATTVKRDFQLPSSFSTAYVRIPFWAK